MDFATWGVPALVLLVGGALGLAATRSGSKKERETARREGHRLDLQSTKDSAVEALKALELERDKLPAADYERERERLVQLGADALRHLEAAATHASPASDDTHELSAELRAALAQERERLGAGALNDVLISELGLRPPRRGGMAPEWRGALWTLFTVAIVGALLVGMQSSVRERGLNGSITGNQQQDPGPAADPNPQLDAEKARWAQALAGDPDNLEALNALTELAFADRDLQTAMDLNSRAITVAPGDADARVYKAVLRASVGMMDDALTGLDTVLAEQPDHAKALVYKGLLALDAGRPQAAVEALERALAGSGAGNPFLQSRLAMARAELGGAAPPPAQPAAAADPIATGTITLAEGVQVTGGAVLFVSVRDPAGGPPVAALKLAPGPFPLSFEITTANVISMGGARPVPERLDLIVRLDADGDAQTRPPGEPTAELRGLDRGAQGLELVLK